MKRFIEGQDRSQVTLLPECLDDYIGQDNSVRVVGAFVEELDLQALGFKGIDPAATETALRMPGGTLQHLYVDSLREAQLESLLDNPLAVTIIDFAEGMKETVWTGTPTDFYEKLEAVARFTAQRSRAWPSSVAVMSKRLHGLQAPLLAQGVSVEMSRSKEREIVVTKLNAASRPAAQDPPVSAPGGGGY